MVPDSALALETPLATLDLKSNERPFMTTLEDNAISSSRTPSISRAIRASSQG
jgi:hypothetical protein